MRMSLARRFLIAATLSSVAACPSAAAAKTGPVITTFTSALAYGIANPDIDPSGSNVWTCKPTAAHPRPVVLLHGNYANRFNSFASLSPTLKGRGYCVFAPDFGKGYISGLNGYAALRTSSAEIATYVDRVLAATGAPQVDIVGYSAGGLVARSYLKYDGGADAADPSRNKVGSLIMLSTPNHGTTLGGLTNILKAFGLVTSLRGALGPGPLDQIAGSAFLTALNAGSETMPGVKYVAVATKQDEVSSPATKAWITAGPGATVQRLALQTGCSTDLSDHFNINYSRRAFGLVLRGLDPTYVGTLPCQVLLPTI